MGSVYFFVALFLLCGLVPAEGTLWLPRYYTNYMVLQRTMENCFSGNATANSVVTMNITNTLAKSNNNVIYTTTAASDSTFQICIPAQLYQSYLAFPFTIVVSDNASSITITDAIYGEVWLCSGQSNMAIHVDETFDGNSTILSNATNIPDTIRIFYTHYVSTIVTPQEDVYGLWQFANESAAGFSDICYIFGLQIALRANVPLGLIGSYVSGTNIIAWSTPASVTECGFAGPSSVIPSQLYNSMIYPLRRLSLAGFLWYQGEQDMNYPIAYQCWFPHMIEDYRTIFNIPDAPWGFMELGSYLLVEQVNALFDVMRYSQVYSTQKLSNVFYSTGMDMTDPFSPYGSIHSRNKTWAAMRIFRQIGAAVYGIKDMPVVGPTVVSCCNKIDTTTNLQTFELTFSSEVSSLVHIQTPYCEQVNASMEQGDVFFHCCDAGPFDITSIPTATMDWTQRMHYHVNNTQYVSNSALLTFDRSLMPVGHQVAEVRLVPSNFPQCMLYNAELPSMLPVLRFNISCPSTCNSQTKVVNVV